MAELVVPSVLAAQAGGQGHFELHGDTLGDALRELPFADLLFDARGEWGKYLLLFVDGEDATGQGGLATPLEEVHQARIVAVVSGG